MKLISWNVAGLRACLKKGFADFFKEVDADVFCLQEIKMEKKDFQEFNSEFNGYYQYWHSAEKKGYSGTLVFTKKEPINVTFGLNNAKIDDEGRVITLEYENFYLVNIYTPNAKRTLERLPYRMEWEDDYRKYLKELEKTKPVISCGDLNVAHEEIDIKNYKSNIGNAGFTYEERGKFTDLLNSGFIDTYRLLNPEKSDAYTWWSYITNAREKNIGWRIDYFIISTSLKNNLNDAIIYSDVYGSDHCPIGIDIF